MLHQFRKKSLLVAMGVAAALFSITSEASMLYIAPQVAPSAIPSVNYPKLHTKGYTKWVAPLRTLHMVGYGIASTHSSYGKNIPVRDAINLIVPPDGWQIFVHSGVSGASLVTWKSHDQPWTEPLRYVLRQAGLMATVNWQHRAILLKVQPHVTPAVLPESSNSKYTSGLATKSYAPMVNRDSTLPSNFHVGAAAPIAPSLAGLTPVFLLNRGDLILTDLQKWAEQSGWKIVWQVPEDWQVPNTTSFSGDFQTAVSQVVRALSSNGANVHAVFHTANNTVVISGAGGGE